MTGEVRADDVCRALIRTRFQHTSAIRPGDAASMSGSVVGIKKRPIRGARPGVLGDTYPPSIRPRSGAMRPPGAISGRRGRPGACGAALTAGSDLDEGGAVRLELDGDVLDREPILE